MQSFIFPRKPNAPGELRPTGGKHQGYPKKPALWAVSSTGLFGPVYGRAPGPAPYTGHASTTLSSLSANLLSPCAPRCSGCHHTLRLGRHLLDLLHNEGTGHDVARLPLPLPADDALAIDEDQRPPGRQAVGGTGMRLEARVALNHLERGGVAEERIRQVQRVRKGFLGKGVLGRNPQHLHPQRLERAVINLPG